MTSEHRLIPQELRLSGWDDSWGEVFEGFGSNASPARVVAAHRDRWMIRGAPGAQAARLDSSQWEGPTPTTGDWVGAVPGPQESDPWSILFVLPRRSAVRRGAAGGTSSAQVLAANVDRVWIVQALDTPPNLRSLERYLAVVWESGASPEIVLSKSDLAQDLEGSLAQVQGIAFGVPLWTTSSEQVESLEPLKSSLSAGSTVALLGPSGAGKSTLVNSLTESESALTGEVREGDRKGRHTTTARELFRIHNGALLMDTPGMRELRVVALDDGLDQTFPDIQVFAERCRFRDCTHVSEPDCAVLAAVERGALGEDRLTSYRKLEAEAAHDRRKRDPRAQAEHVADRKTSLKTLKYHPKHQRRE